MPSDRLLPVSDAGDLERKFGVDSAPVTTN